MSELTYRNYRRAENLWFHAMTLKATGKKCLVFSLYDMDELIRHGVQPSQLVLDGELGFPKPDLRIFIDEFAGFD